MAALVVVLALWPWGGRAGPREGGEAAMLVATPRPNEPPPPPVDLVVPAEVPGGDPPPPPLDRAPRFLGRLDDEILERICHQPVKSVGVLGGGASISLKMVFADGSKAAVKPDQLRVTKFSSEVAAYRVARALGLGMVPPSCVRTFPKETLYAGMSKAMQARMDEEMRVDKKGGVACAVIAWVPELHGLVLEKATWWQPLLRRGAPIPAARRRRLLDISTLLLFDFLIINDDRWSGGNTHAAGEQMVFIDQGAGFGSDRKGRRGWVMSQLRWSQRFDRDVAEALFTLDVAALKEDLKGLLTESDLGELEERVEEARAYLRKMQGEAQDDSLLLGTATAP